MKLGVSPIHRRTLLLTLMCGAFLRGSSGDRTHHALVYSQRWHLASSTTMVPRKRDALAIPPYFQEEFISALLTVSDPTENRTRISGVKIHRNNLYTIGPCSGLGVSTTMLLIHSDV